LFLDWFFKIGCLLDGECCFNLTIVGLKFKTLIKGYLGVKIQNEQKRLNVKEKVVTFLSVFLLLLGRGS
jgi:hypothetical protein